MFALIDATSFYASCEQIFRPELRGTPVAVLSNNDGSVIALSPEAKALGIPNFEPYFKVRPLLEKHRAAVFSSNFPLYGDISSRMVGLLESYGLNVEPYSIDEVFLELPELREDWNAVGHDIRQRIWREVRIPVGIGAAPSKTLAKLANKASKKIPKCRGVCVLEHPHQWEWLLRRSKTTDIWGVASRTAARLADLGIRTGWDLARANPKQVRRRCNINIERIIEELNGRPCFPLEEGPPSRQQIYATRSFGERVFELGPLQEAVSSFAARAVERLRQQRHWVTAMQVFVQTSPFQPDYHRASAVIQTPYPTDDLRLITGLVRRAVKKLYEPGRAYAKAGVGLIELVDKDQHQFDLLSQGQDHRADRLMEALDAINQRFGRGTVALAAEGIHRPWAMKQEWRSPEYTTKWRDLPVIKA